MRRPPVGLLTELGGAIAGVKGGGKGGGKYLLMIGKVIGGKNKVYD